MVRGAGILQKGKTKGKEGMKKKLCYLLDKSQCEKERKTLQKEEEEEEGEARITSRKKKRKTIHRSLI